MEFSSKDGQETVCARCGRPILKGVMERQNNEKQKIHYACPMALEVLDEVSKAPEELFESA